jgi:uncharacterized protein (DUF885 family)
MMRIILSVSLLLFANSIWASDKMFEALLTSHWKNAQTEQIFFRMDMDAWRFSGPLADMSPAGETRRQRFNQKMLDQLAAIELKTLSRNNQISYQIFRYERETESESYRQPVSLYPITNRDGWHNSFANAPANMSFLTLADYEKYLVSLAGYPRFNRQHISLLDNAVREGHTQFCTSMIGFEQSISTQIVSDPTHSALYQPFADLPASTSAQTGADLRSRARDIISKDVIPAYRELLDFYLTRYQPHCRTKEGISSRVGGEDFYRYLVRFHTTTKMTPSEIHQLGLDEVDRIHKDMQLAIEASGFDGSFAEFLEFLRSDARFYTSDEEDLLEKASRIAKRMDGQLPRLFATLPSLPYDIREIPISIAEKTTGAYYTPAPGDGRTPGTYYVNTSLLASRPLYTLEALTFHEAVPGHHLQTALALENDIPDFRRYLYYSAFGEGWGLYAESLGLEVGFYDDPYSNFGRLSYEMWRACRLVVDTGLHAFGWSRQQAIDYMATRTALSLHEITAEVDRYITWPGQALSYKIGELRIRQLRTEAEQTLGDKFDLREFHDKILENGSLPIAVLESLTREWLEKSQIERTTP